jgi:hypothetical protein|tara:strand:- start:9142 stop:9333 length:192 start_codon:yes stop_codon:yes gene_type:complete
MQQELPGTTAAAEVDFSQHPNARNLLKRCQDFFSEVENLYGILRCHLVLLIAPGHQAEIWKRI